MTLTVSQNLPPVPSAMKIAQGEMVTQPWQQWFVNLTAKVNQINAVLVAISGAGTPLEAFNTLSPLTTNGDLLTYNTGNNVRLGIGSNGQVLTVVAGLPAWAPASGGGGGGIGAINTRTTNSYTLVLGDANALIDFNVSGDSTLSIPLNSSVNFPVPSTIYVGGRNNNIVVTPLNSTTKLVPIPRVMGSQGGGYIVQVATDVWYVFGNLLTRPYTYFSFAGGSTTGWTTSGTVAVSSTQGNPPPSILISTSGYMYQNITSIASFSNKRIFVDLYIVGGVTCVLDFYFACNSSGVGRAIRLDGRNGSNLSGITTSSAWGTVPAPTPSNAFFCPCGVWHTFQIAIDSSNNISLIHPNGTLCSYVAAATLSGTYLGCGANAGAGAGFGNLYITDY